MIQWPVVLAFGLPETIDQWIRMFQFFVVLYFSISFHECAHAWAANRNGDDTARLMGRMTLNPIPHIDIIGTVVIPFLFFFSGGFRLIGWGKPVPVNPLRFKNYHRGEIETSLAGPASNLILVIGASLVLRLLYRFAPGWAIPIDLLWMVAGLNTVLCLFNLIPIYPLDGSHVLKRFLSKEAAETYDRVITPYGWLILLVLLNIRALDFIFYFGNRILLLLVGH
ncbi:site-2 protease family protein [bacterium]|nr:site-2 protease family protein [bacterium]